MAARKLLLTLLLILLLNKPLLCQDATNTESPWPLDVFALELVVGNANGLGTGNITATGIGGNMRASGGAIGSGVGSQQKVSFVLVAKNPSGDKTIKSIEWEASFTNTQNKPVSNKFKSKKKIKPSKEEKIEETIFYNTASIPTTVKLGFRIKKIEYEDNSVWENKAPEGDYVYNSKPVN